MSWLGHAVPRCAARCRALPCCTVLCLLTVRLGSLLRSCSAPKPFPLPPDCTDVAEAIFESVLPRNAGDVLPSTPAGLLVSVADK